MTRSMTAFLFLSSLALAAPAVAGTKPDGASFTIDAGAVLYDHDLKLETGPSVGARLGYDFNKWFGVEGRFTYLDSRSTATASKPQAHAFTYRVDSLGYLLPESRFVPYVAAGVGEMSIRNRDTFGDQDSLLLNYGLGAKLFLLDSLALRLDARHLVTFDNNQHSHGEFTFGVNYYFGGTGSSSKAASTTVGCPIAAAVHPMAPHGLLIAPSARVAAPAESAAPAPVAAPVEAAAPVAVATPAVVAAPAAAPAAAVAAETAAPAEAAKKSEPAAAAAPTIGHIGMLVDAAEVKAATGEKSRPTVGQKIGTRITAITKIDNGVRISTTRDIKDFRVAALSKPSRVYVDVFTGVNGTGKQKIAMNSGAITDVRVAQYPNKARVVLDFSGDKIPRYKVVRTAAGLEFLFDKAGSK